MPATGARAVTRAAAAPPLAAAGPTWEDPAMRHHEWRDRTEDGELRLLRASHHGGRWRVEARLKSEEDFVELDPIPADDLEVLLDVVENKYRRGRAPHEHVIQLQGLLDEARARRRR